MDGGENPTLLNFILFILSALGATFDGTTKRSKSSAFNIPRETAASFSVMPLPRFCYRGVYHIYMLIQP
jgi:hypothetical protein